MGTALPFPGSATELSCDSDAVNKDPDPPTEAEQPEKDKFHIHKSQFAKVKPHFLVTKKEMESYFKTTTAAKTKKAAKTTRLCSHFNILLQFYFVDPWYIFYSIYLLNTAYLFAVYLSDCMVTGCLL